MGEVLKTIRKKYAFYFRIAAKTVVTNHSLRSQLEDIATVAETSDKARLLDRHDDWLEILDEALSVVEKHLAKYTRALKLLELEFDIEEFRNGCHKRATNRCNVAKRAKKHIVNLIDDLCIHLND